MSAAVLISKVGFAGLLAPALAVLLYLALPFPEVTFALFLNAGLYKADPRLEVLQLPTFFDLTLFFEALCIVGILIGVLRRRVRIFGLPSQMLFPYFTIAGMSIVSLMYTAAPIYGTDKLLRFLVITSFSLFGPWVLFQHWQRIKRFFMAYIAVSTAMVLDVLSGGLEPGEFVFQSAFGGSSGYLGLASVTAQSLLVLVFAFLLTTSNMWHRLLILGLIILNTFGMLVSGARTATIVLGAMIAGVLVYISARLAGQMLLIAKVQRSDVRIVRALSEVVFVLMVLGAWANEYFATIPRIALSLEAPVQYTAVRTAMFAAAGEAIGTYPLGLGIGGFSMYYFDYDNAHSDTARGGFPHNVFLEVGSELGLVGLGGFVLLCHSLPSPP